MNPDKFIQRIRLFNDIIHLVFDVESNYGTELNLLNLTINSKIEEYISLINSKKHRLTMKSSKNVNPQKNITRKSSLKLSKSKDNNLFSKVEDNPMIDKLISDSLQHLLTFYKTKHKLVSKEVSNLGVVLHKFTTSYKKFDNYNDLTILEKCKNDFELKYTNLIRSKKKYFEKMNGLELLFQEEEKKKYLKRINSHNITINNKNNKNNINIINNNEIQKEKEKIDKVIELRQKYKNSIIELTNYQKIYKTKLNEVINDVKEFNVNENDILLDIFKVYEENLLSILNEVNNFHLLFEHNKKIIKSLNFELENNLIYDGRINFNYKFEEYKPKNIDVSNQIDYSVIQKMNKLVGFEFDIIKLKKPIKEEIINDEDENIKINNIIMENNNKGIDDNLLFILLMDKLTNGDSILEEKEKDLMKKLFNDKMYIKEFLSKLNKIRMSTELFSSKERFYILVEFFNFIFTKLYLKEKNEHELINYMMILSETFKYMEGDKKIFLINVVKTPDEFKDSKFWINYIEIEIEIEYKKNDYKKDSRSEYIVFLSNTTHLKEYILPNETIQQIIDYFKKKYNFTSEEMDIIQGQLNL